MEIICIICKTDEKKPFQLSHFFSTEIHFSRDQLSKHYGY